MRSPRSDDGTLPADCPLIRWNNLIIEASIKLGCNFDVATTHKQRLAEAGFVNVVQKEYKWPINTWPRDKKLKNIGKIFPLLTNEK